MQYLTPMKRAARRRNLLLAARISRTGGFGKARAIQFGLLTERMLRRGVDLSAINAHINTLADKYLPLEDL